MFSQIDTIILGVCSKACPSYPKQQNNNSSQCLCNISKKKLEMKLIFCMQVKIKVSCKFISKRWVSKVSCQCNTIITAAHDQAFSRQQVCYIFIFQYLIFLQYINKRVSQLFLRSIVMQNTQIFYGGPVMLIVACSLAQPDCRNFLPDHCNTIIKQQLCGVQLPSLLLLLQLHVFQEKQGILQQVSLCPSNKPKKACTRPCDTNNSSFTRMYHHTATESLYRQAVLGHPPQQECPIHLALFVFQFVADKISGSSVFPIFHP